MSFPPHPTLIDLWSGSSRLEVTGPSGERVQFEVIMTSLGGGKPLSRETFSSLLPVSEERWSQLLRGVQGNTQLDSVVGDSEEMVVRVSHAALGSIELRAGRPFEPLRWTAGRDRAGPFARLINHTAEHPVITCFPPDHPATSEVVSYVEEDLLRLERGGLILAKCGELQAAIVLPPHVSGGLDALGLLNVRPSLQTGPRTVDSVRSCISLARLWGGIAVPADESAAHIQKRVLDAIRSRLGGLIGGKYWSDVEHHLLDGGASTAALLFSGVGNSGEERRIAEDLVNRCRAQMVAGSSPRNLYVDAIATDHRWLPHALAGLIARLARAPETLDVGDGRLIEAIVAALKRPATFRLARLLVASESIDFDAGSLTDR